METGRIKEWNAEEGAELSPGMELAEVETDKATIAFEC